MRSPFCIHCGQKITHFGKGYKYSLIKVKGGYCHESCYEKHKSIKKKRVYTPEQRRIWNRTYWWKHRDFKFRRRHNFYWNLNLEESILL